MINNTPLEVWREQIAQVLYDAYENASDYVSGDRWENAVERAASGGVDAEIRDDYLTMADMLIASGLVAQA